MAIDGSELDLTSCGRLPRDSDADGPGLSSKSDSGLEAYDRRDVFMGNRKSSDKDSAGCVMMMMMWQAGDGGTGTQFDNSTGELERRSRTNTQTHTGDT